MKQITLQVPINKQLRDKAKKAAEKQGFSSLQEMIRVLLNQIIQQEIRMGFVADSLPLSLKNEKRYAKMLADKSS